jgi:hypothetical protein
MAVTKEQIEADIKKFVTTYCQTGAKTAADEFTKMAEIAIQGFYSSYSPKKYFRTDDMLLNSYKRYYHSSSRNYYGGVDVSDEQMKAYKHTPGPGYKFGRNNPGSIVQGVWQEGYRGPKAPSSDSPIDALITMTLGNQSLINSILNKARQAAVSQSYSAIKAHVS